MAILEEHPFRLGLEDGWMALCVPVSGGVEVDAPFGPVFAGCREEAVGAARDWRPPDHSVVVGNVRTLDAGFDVLWDPS